MTLTITPTTLCGSCGRQLGTSGLYHHRLRAYVHSADACMSNLRGEDVRRYCMTLVRAES
jgi:hypothetical protein